MKAAKLLTAKPKKKCCRSRPRCSKCPVVIHQVQKASARGITGKDLDKVAKAARKR